MSTKAKRKEEYEGRIKQALVILNDVSNDNTTPEIFGEPPKMHSTSYRYPT